MSDLPLPYNKLKTLHNSPSSEQINPYFGRWEVLPHFPRDLSVYSCIVDTTRQIAYTRPKINTGGLIRLAENYLDPSGNEVRLTEVLLFYSEMVYIHAHTEQGNYLIAVPVRFATDTALIIAHTYKSLVRRRTDPPRRPVIAADRQIHWVWFRRTPTWRLEEEIVLRAASWIELNPGYTFNLWTNLADEAELTDFLADLPADLRERYFAADGSIRVRFAAEFRSTIFGWLEDNASAHTEAVFAALWESTERQDIVLKTDYTRNILLAVHGGIYADFNDLLCLEPIEPLLEVHAGNYVGVSDTSHAAHASNYFMYASADNPEWQDIVLRCVETLPLVCRAIHRTTSVRAAKQILRTALHGAGLDLAAVKEALSVSPLRADNITEHHYLHALCLALGRALKDAAAAAAIRDFAETALRRGGGRRGKSSAHLELSMLLKTQSAAIEAVLDSAEFAAAWRFALTDMYLQPIMRRSNLPIFCREQEIPLWMVPFSYLIRYACMVSFVGHLGDGSSYGMDPTRKTTMRRLLGVSST